MNVKFKEKVDKLPTLLDSLMNSPPKPWSNLGSFPGSGIYVFFEEGQAIYVGRSNRMAARIKEHGQPSSLHNSAPFAFNLAKSEGTKKGINVSGTRGDLAKDPDFAKLFVEAKQRVSRMYVRAIGVKDPIIQTLLEVYAAMALETTAYNDFGTH